MVQVEEVEVQVEEVQVVQETWSRETAATMTAHGTPT